MAGSASVACQSVRAGADVGHGMSVTKARVAQLMFDHFPVRQVTPFGLIGMFCNCGVRVEGTWADHVKIVVDEAFSFSEQAPKLNTRTKK